MMRFSNNVNMNEVPVGILTPESVTHLVQAVPCTRKEKTALPPSFTPHSYCVILGRGKVNESIGNRRLKILVDLELNNYVKAKSRREKSYVVARVMETIQDAGGAFVRCEGGIWYEVDDSEAREKISTLFRDKLSDHYKSSTSNKVEKRRQLKAARKKKFMNPEWKAVSFVNLDVSRIQAEIMNKSTSDCSSTTSI
mmetsp:Transcript_24856/g.40661  ORF Transcript_24856/g.40661 Transcript_24856/m.40661 type:complete len:196 (-) Transcript_24856:54-641(-)